MAESEPDAGRREMGDRDREQERGAESGDRGQVQGRGTGDRQREGRDRSQKWRTGKKQAADCWD